MNDYYIKVLGRESGFESLKFKNLHVSGDVQLVKESIQNTEQ